MNNFISRDDFTCLVVIGLSSGLRDKFFNLFVQAFGFHQLFQCQVHAPAPIVTRVGGNIDALFLYIRVAPFTVHRHPVLQGEYAEDGVAVQVFAYNLFAKFGRGHRRSGAVMSEHGIVVTLRLQEVFFPPAAQQIGRASCRERV